MKKTYDVYIALIYFLNRQRLGSVLYGHTAVVPVSKMMMMKMLDLFAKGVSLYQ